MPLGRPAVEVLRLQLERRWHSAIAHAAKPAMRGRLSGLAELDELIAPAGVPDGQLTEIVGPSSCGKTGLAFAILATFLREGSIAAYVDPCKSFYAPFAPSSIDLKRLVVVRPHDAAAMRRAIDALVRGGAFAAVLVDCGEYASRLQTHHCTRLVAQAAKSGTTLLALSHGDAHTLASFAALRLRVGEIEPVWQHGSDGQSRLSGYRTNVSLIKSRSAPPGRRVVLTALLPHVDNTWPAQQKRTNAASPLDHDGSNEASNSLSHNRTLFDSGVLAREDLALRSASSAG